MMRLRAAFVIPAIVLLTQAHRAAAHDFWIQPAKFICEKGASVDVALRVGDEIPGEPVKHDPARIQRFVAIDELGERAIPAKEGADPAGAIRVRAEGVTTIAYESHFKRIELEAAKFEEYLRSVGLEKVIEQRANLKQSAKPGRESYGRCALSILHAGSGSARAFRSPGLPVELQPIDTEVAANGEMHSFRLVFNKKPLADALVIARHMTSKEIPDQKLRTNADGMVRFKLADAGPWLLTNVHMIAVAGEPDVDWRSYWASLTFDLKFSTNPASRPVAEVETPAPQHAPASSQPAR